MSLSEEWRDIKGCEGAYLVSNLGRVKSLARIKDRKRQGKYPIPERIMKPTSNGRGYLFVTLVGNGGERIDRTIHHLVWDAFGDEPRDGHRRQIDHIDNNSVNNRIDNLRLVNAHENSIKRSAQHKKTSRYPNVALYKEGKWEMSIMRNRKRYRKAAFNTETEAFLYRQKLLITLGEQI